MPSPFQGLMAAAASPITTQFGPASGEREKDICRAPPTGSVILLSSESPQYPGAAFTQSAIILVVLACFHRLNVERRPTPTLTVPSPRGNTHP